MARKKFFFFNPKSPVWDAKVSTYLLRLLLLCLLAIVVSLVSAGHLDNYCLKKRNNITIVS